MRYAAIYSRVSTAKQDNQSQIDDLLKLSKEMGYSIKDEDVYTDTITGFSKKETRAGLNSLIEKIHTGERKYGIIFVWEISRISRDPIEGRKIVDDLSERGISVYIKTLNMQSLDEDGVRNPIFSLVFQVLIEFAKSEADYFKLRSRRGLKKSAMEGKAGGGRVLPYGYKKEGKMLVVDDSEAEVVRKIYALSLQGLGTKRIAAYLNSHSIPTRYNKNFDKAIVYKDGRQSVDSKSIKWADGVVYGILTNSLYIGKRKFKGEIINAPSIISDGEWEQVQLQLGQNFKEATRNTRYLYILKDLLKCDVCGRNYFGRYKSDLRDKFYMCSSRRLNSGNCGNRGVSIEGVESCVWNTIRMNPRVKTYLSDTNKSITAANKELKNIETEIEITRAELTESNKRYNRIIDLGIKGVYKEDELIKFKEKEDAKIENHELKLNALEQKRRAKIKYKDEIESYDDYLKAINEIGTDRHKIREIISALVDKITIRALSESDFLLVIHLRGLKISVLFQKKEFRCIELHGTWHYGYKRKNVKPLSELKKSPDYLPIIKLLDMFSPGMKVGVIKTPPLVKFAL